MAQITDAKIAEVFSAEIAAQTTPADVEVYGLADGEIYVRRFHTAVRQRGVVPPMTAFMVAVFNDGTREELITNDPEEITAWTNLMRR